MAGTKAGGKLAAAKNLAKDPNFYKRIGQQCGKAGEGHEYRKGGSKATGFAADLDRAREAGRKGGYISVRPSKKVQNA